jgi:hypothetical protein
MFDYIAAVSEAKTIVLVTSLPLPKINNSVTLIAFLKGGSKDYEFFSQRKIFCQNSRKILSLVGNAVADCCVFHV